MDWILLGRRICLLRITCGWGGASLCSKQRVRIEISPERIRYSVKYNYDRVIYSNDRLQFTSWHRPPDMEMLIGKNGDSDLNANGVIRFMFY